MMGEKSVSVAMPPLSAITRSRCDRVSSVAVRSPLSMYGCGQSINMFSNYSSSKSLSSPVIYIFFIVVY